MRANHATPELQRLVDHQTAMFQQDAPEDVRIAATGAIHAYQEQHRGDEL
jgi:hypothetical protein